MFEEKFFAHRKKNDAKLLRYGFARQADGYRYATSVMEGQFMLHVSVDAFGHVATRMIDSATGEEYTLYRVATSVGAFVGSVRAACEAVLTDIAAQCYEPNIFRSAQTLAVIDYVRRQYGDELEFLWEKFPDSAVWRRRDNRKWYGIVMTVSKRKLGLDSDEVAEIIDLRLSPERMPETVDRERYFPGWHMNKKSWYTMLLDGSVPTEEICRRMDESYRLAAGPGR